MHPFTTETVFNGRVSLVQPKDGYRYTTDAVLLAAHASPGPQTTLLDIGTGSAVMLVLLAWRHKTVQFTGVEIQEDLAAFARENALINGMTDRLRIVQADITQCREKDFGCRFDTIISNPPFRKLSTGRLNPSSQKAIARHELTLTLEKLTRAAGRLLVPRGTFTLIYPVERIKELEDALTGENLFPQWIRFVHTRPDRPAFRAILSASNAAGGAMETRPPLYLTDASGKPSPEFTDMFTS